MQELTTAWIIGQLAWAALAVVACIALGIHRPARVVGPRRLSPGEPNSLLGLMFFIVIAGWLLPQFLLGSLLHTGSPTDDGNVSPALLVGLGALGYAGAVVGLLLGNRVRRRPIGDFGLRLAQLPRGIREGAIGALIAIPLVFWVGVGTEMVYQRVAYEHPTEHEMLRMLTEASPLTWLMIVVSAVLLAPVAEELIFRGLLQTLIVRAAGRLGGRVASASPAAPILPGSNVPLPRSAWACWAGILLSSVLFASVHEPWSIPPIFALSVCMGYIYERTGNLWSAITLHLLFNASSTAQFLLMR